MARLMAIKIPLVTKVIKELKMGQQKKVVKP
jgi:hypothetical protein